MGWSDVIFGYELPVLTPKVGMALTLASIAVIGTALLFIHARLVYPSRRCPKCGDDRTHAESEVCTECGIRPSSGAFRLPPWSTIAWISLLCIATLSWPAYKAFRWSEVRGWTPPLPAYRVEVVRTFSTGHTLQRLHCRNPFSPDYPFVLRVIDAGGTERVAYPCDGCGGSIGLWTMDEAPERIDGDEFADVIFVNSSSGTQCFATYTCYRLAPDGSVVLSWTREDGCDAVFQDVDGDGNVEIVTIDDYRYVFACGACLNPHVRTVYQFFGDGWILDTDAMAEDQAPPNAGRDSDEQKIHSVLSVFGVPLRRSIDGKMMNPALRPLRIRSGKVVPVQARRCTAAGISCRGTDCSFRRSSISSVTRRLLIAPPIRPPWFS